MGCNDIKAPIYAVMVPIQKDGLGEWIDPDIPVWFYEENAACEWAREWARTHAGLATVYRCTPIVDIRLIRQPAFEERRYGYPRS